MNVSSRPHRARATQAAFGCAFALAFGAALACAACSPPPPPPGDVSDAGPADVDAFNCPEPPIAGSFDGGCPVRRVDQSQCMELTVGTGRDGTFDDFQPLRDGDSIVVTPGSQGAQHIVIALRGIGFDPTLPIWEAAVVRADDCVEVGRQRYRFPFVADPLDRSRFALRAVELLITDGDSPRPDRLEYCTILGRDVVIVLEFDDLNGRRARREVRTHVSGIDPATRPDIRQAWINACDGGTGGDASSDARARD